MVVSAMHALHARLHGDGLQINWSASTSLIKKIAFCMQEKMSDEDRQWLAAQGFDSQEKLDAWAQLLDQLHGLRHGFCIKVRALCLEGLSRSRGRASALGSGVQPRRSLMQAYL